MSRIDLGEGWELDDDGSPYLSKRTFIVAIAEDAEEAEELGTRIVAMASETAPPHVERAFREAVKRYLASRKPTPPTTSGDAPGEGSQGGKEDGNADV